MVITSTKQGNSIYDEMKSRSFDLYMMERQTAYEAYTASDEVARSLNKSEDDYNFNLLKLDSLIVLQVRPAVVQCGFIKTKLYIDALDISEKQKIDAILTSACILKDFGTGLINKNILEEELYLLACAMVNVEPSSYSYYENLILGHFDRLVKMLKNIEGLTIKHVKQDKQYIKTENN